LNPLGLSLEPPGSLLTHPHTVYMAYSECLLTRLNPLAERTCFSQVSELELPDPTLLVRHYMIQPLVELYGGWMAVLKVW
jgi:hypothetical protein